MKYAAIALAVLSTTLTGLNYTHSMSLRVERLGDIKILLNSFKIQLEFTAKPVYEILRLLSVQDLGSANIFVTACVKNIESGETVPTAWEKACRTYSEIGGFKKEDTGILRAFGSKLGVCDLKGQLSLCQIYEKMLEESLIKAQKYKEKNGSLYSSLGFMLGLAIGIILI